MGEPLRAAAPAPRPRTRRLPVACVAAALAACGGEGPGPAGAPESDISVRPGTATLTIGSVEGEGTDAFGRVTGLAQDGEGRIYVADGQASEVRVFASTGDFLFRFGGEGQGPGELSRPCCLAFGPEGRLWVRDGGNARYAAFRVEGDSAAPDETRRMAHGDVNRWAPLTFDAEGRLVDVGTGTAPGTDDPAMGRFMLGPGGEILDQEVLETPTPAEQGAKVITRETGQAVARMYFWPPHPRAYMTAHGPLGRWAEAFTSAYEVRVHGPDGSVGMIRGPQIQGPFLTPAEREAAQRSLDDERRRAGEDLGFTVPERKQPLRHIFYDTEGRIWVELSVSAGEARQADLFGPEGRLLERRTWPADVELGLPGWVGSDQALGLATDSLGVQRVVRVAW